MTTSYSLRSASPAKTRADAVVVGVLSGEVGPTLAPGGEDVADAYGRKLRPLLASMGITGKAGQAVPVPTGDTVRTPLLIFVGLGPSVSTDSIRAGAGVAARSVPNASSVALALPADTPELVDAVTQGHLLGGYRFTRYKSSPPSADEPGEVVVLSAAARTEDAKVAFERAQVVAAAVVQATLALASLGVPVAITCVAPMAENMISGRASRPGDVVTTLSGRTVELANLDAEGRMLLCDGLTLALESEPDVVIDVATLTGHMQVALGDHVAAVMGEPDLVDRVVAAGERAGEMHWPMPIPEEMPERVRASKVADLLQHDWVRWGGGLYAAAFLREFTDGVPWAHLDIAGCEFTSGTRGHVTPGGTGWGTATVVALVESLAESLPESLDGSDAGDADD